QRQVVEAVEAETRRPVVRKQHATAIEDAHGHSVGCAEHCVGEVVVDELSSRGMAAEVGVVALYGSGQDDAVALERLAIGLATRLLDTRCGATGDQRGGADALAGRISDGLGDAPRLVRNDGTR